MLGRLRGRLRALVRRDTMERELDAELRYHLERQIELNVAGGMSAEEARRAALKAFGGVEQAKEGCREARGVRLVEDLWQDVRYGVRTLLRKPGFTVAAVITLALGIGANAAIFSVVNAVLLRPLPYRDSDKLVWLWETNLQQGQSEVRVSPPTFLDWRAQQQSFEGLAAYSEAGFVLTGGDEPEKIEAASVSANFFTLLGVRPALGRDFLAEDDQAGRGLVVIISDGIWRRRFGSDPRVVGRGITLDGKSYEVIGVAPPGLNNPRGAQMWTPLMPTMADALSARGAHYLVVFGRLKGDSTLRQAEAEMNSITGRIAQEDSSYAAFGVRLVPLQEQLVGEVRPALLILFAAVGLVMLVACANVANLLLARTATRRREVAIRAAVGASRGRLIRQLLTESMMLALGGGLLGVLWAAWSVDLLIALSPQAIPRTDEIGVDGWVVSFVLLISLLTGLIFGLLTALQSSKADLGAWLKEGGGGVAGGQRSNRARRLLIISEVALTLVLLSGAGLMLNSFLRLLQVDPGFNPEKVITFRFVLPASKYSEKPKQVAFFRQLLEGVEALPEVRSAGMVRNLPVSGQSMTSPVIIEGRPPSNPGEQPSAQHVAVDPGYFGAIGIRLTEGRAFTERDGAEAAPVAIINEALARRFFPGEDPVGKRLRTNFGRPPVMRQVVGVVGDVKHVGLGLETPPQVFVPFLQNPERFMTVVVKTGADPAATMAAVRGAVRAVDPDQPIDQVATMEALLSESMAQPRFYTLLLGSFAIVALLLASVGLYGVMSYTVTQRTHEIGVRMALGAQPADILRMVVGQGMVLVALGVGVGLVGAFALTRFISKLLYGVSASDPTTFSAITLLLTSVALAACYIPALRATRVDPTVALRYE